jgi:hypothetical protein
MEGIIFRAIQVPLWRMTNTEKNFVVVFGNELSYVNQLFPADGCPEMTAIS